MRLFEYEGREIFAKYGITVSPAVLVRSVEEALQAAETFGYPVVVKAQVLTGGRGKAGGVRIAANQAELAEHTGRILGLVIKGEKTESVLLSRKNRDRPRTLCRRHLRSAERASRADVLHQRRRRH